MRGLVSTAIVAVIVSLVTVSAVGAIAQEPQPVTPAVVSRINAHRVDGKHAVGSRASILARRNKLVATARNGYLPSNIVKPLWDLIQGKPAGFADGVDNVGYTTSVYDYGSGINAGATAKFGSLPLPRSEFHQFQVVPLATTSAGGLELLSVETTRDVAGAVNYTFTIKNIGTTFQDLRIRVIRFNVGIDPATKRVTLSGRGPK